VSDDSADKPGTIFERVRDIVARRLDCPPEQVTADTSLHTPPDMDSLEGVEIMIDVEEAFDISIRDQDAERMQTIGDLARYVELRGHLPETLPVRAHSPSRQENLPMPAEPPARVPRDLPVSTADEETITLFRPVGQKELDLVRESGWREFPPRLSFQPIFYPVLTEEYAARIARDWNTVDEASGYVGYVLRFRVRAGFLKPYPVESVGGEAYQEYWIPAEELDAFNRNIVGPIEVISEFRPASAKT